MFDVKRNPILYTVLIWLSNLQYRQNPVVGNVDIKHVICWTATATARSSQTFYTAANSQQRDLPLPQAADAPVQLIHTENV